MVAHKKPRAQSLELSHGSSVSAFAKGSHAGVMVLDPAGKEGRQL
jgi:hypothetical protein